MNAQIFQLINSWAGKNPWFDRVMVFSADMVGYVLIAGVLFYLWQDRRKYFDMALVSIVSAVVARFGIVSLVRYFYYNPRPFVAMDDVISLLEHEATSSFPSGHAAFYFALATGVYLYNKKAGYAYLAVAGVMGFARIFAGVHWPLDIVAGAAVGTLTAILIGFLKEKMPRRAVSSDSSNSSGYPKDQSLV